MNYYERAQALKEETVANRRYLHYNAEVGLNMPKAQAYVMEKLAQFGLEPKACGQGVTATIGKPGKCILLRADMDALSMPEESGLEFACPTGTEAHCCGHDLHAAMLLTAAKLLKENEAELNGTVKFMFQPGEENFTGAKNMIENGILEDPKPDVAMAYHVGPGKIPMGMFMYNDSGKAVMNSMDGFEIRIQGRGSHGAYPQMSIDPINIGVHVHLALQELIARECTPSDSCVVTVGQFNAGSAPNIIPESAVLTGTIRTNSPDARKLLLKRLTEVSELTAKVYGGTAEVVMTGGVGPLICDPALTKEMVGYMKELPVPGLTGYPGITASASEDFALVAEQIPSTFMYLAAGFLDERGNAAAHNPKVVFNEDVLPIGASCLAQCATQWLKN
ncbi:MAG: M20 family metallopeptidase, partial [Faecousia sp.]